jgi:hypothetical protein
MLATEIVPELPIEIGAAKPATEPAPATAEVPKPVKEIAAVQARQPLKVAVQARQSLKVAVGQVPRRGPRPEQVAAGHSAVVVAQGLREPVRRAARRASPGWEAAAEAWRAPAAACVEEVAACRWAAAVSVVVAAVALVEAAAAAAAVVAAGGLILI